MGIKYRKERLLILPIFYVKLQLQIVSSMFISGITGNVSINDNGDRDADYALLDMDPETGIFQVDCTRLTFLQILILLILILACCDL